MTELHIALAIVLFFITNWIGQHSTHIGYMKLSVLAKADEAPAFNFIYRAFSPVAFITIASAALYSINLDKAVKDIHLVTVYYFAARVAFNIATGKGRLINWRMQAAYIATSVPASYYVYEKLITHKQFLFPTSQELGTAIWLAIAAFIYHTANNVRGSDGRTRDRKLAYLKHRYKTYDKLYGNLIREISETKKQEILIMAILIYEAFNRPRIYRVIENGLFRFGLSRTLGIMQVTTDVPITDEESVRLGSRKIINEHQAALFELESRQEKIYSWNVRRQVIASYNRDNSYIDEVTGIYEQLVDTYFPEEKDDVSSELGKPIEPETT